MSIITFHELIPNARPPMRATKNAGGTLPDRHHLCEPVRAASGFGWYIFLPVSFDIVFDGTEAEISVGGANLVPLHYIQLADFASSYAAAAPLEAQAFAPPFVSYTDDHAIVQIWTGYVARTAPGYSLWIRGPANFIAGLGYHNFEGVVESDHYYGPLSAMVKLLKTDVPIHFSNERPFLQVAPIRRADYTDAILNDFNVIEGFTDFDWPAYSKAVVKPNIDPVNRRVGNYSREVRKREAEESR